MDESVEVPKITSMLGVLQDKANRQRDRIRKILEKPRAERNKQMLKKLLKENKAIRKVLKQSKKQESKTVCPHCGQEIHIPNDLPK
jgi:hypothetical protein